MGTCASGMKRKWKGGSAPADKSSSTDNKPKEDVTYASIDHSSAKGSRRTRGPAAAASDDDCDYAIVNVPAALPPEPDRSSKDECDDDYVLMG